MTEKVRCNKNTGLVMQTENGWVSNKGRRIGRFDSGKSDSGGSLDG